MTVDEDSERVLTVLLGMQRQSWEQGVAGHALLDMGRVDLVRVLARDAVTRQTPTGKLAEIDDDGLVNCAANAEAVRWLAAADRDPGVAAAFDRQLRWIQQLCPRAADGTLFHLAGSREVWVDTVYMVVPLLAAVGDVDGAAAALQGHRRRLHDPSSQLYAARWDEDRDRLSRDRKWGTGNGWVVAGIARALHHLAVAETASTETVPAGTLSTETLPAETRSTETGSAGTRPTTNATDGDRGLIATFRRDAAEHALGVIDACLAARRSDGLFGDVLDDPASFSEANLAQMLAYAIFTGIADGWVPAGLEDVGRSLVAAARTRVDGDGFVTGVCGAPRFDRPGTSAEAQAFFLLATAAQRRLARLTSDDSRG